MNIIKARKKLNDLERRASLGAKQQDCKLCGRPQTSFCRSHLIPDFVLRNIALEGHVISACGVIDLNDIVQTDMQIVDYAKGHRDACVFFIICRSCDNQFFADYENECSLLSGLSNKMLAEIAVKNHLMMLSKRYHEIELYKLIDQELSQLEGKDALDEIHKQDIRDEEFQLRRSKKIINKDLKSGYIIIFSTILDWVAPIAVQTPIAFYRDLEGNVLNDVYSESDEVIMRDAHLVVFPLSSKTLVALFYHRDDRIYTKFQQQFNKLPHLEKLEMINYFIFKYSENYVLSPSIASPIINNAALRRLSSEVGDLGGLGIAELKDLRKKYDPVKPSDIPNFLLMSL